MGPPRPHSTEALKSRVPGCRYLTTVSPPGRPRFPLGDSLMNIKLQISAECSVVILLFLILLRLERVGLLIGGPSVASMKLISIERLSKQR